MKGEVGGPLHCRPGDTWLVYIGIRVFLLDRTCQDGVHTASTAREQGEHLGLAEETAGLDREFLM